MIIDFRVRPPFGGYLETHMYRDRARTAQMARDQHHEPPPALAEARWEGFLHELQESGVDRGVVPGRRAGPAFGDVPNEDLAWMARESGGRLVAFAGVRQEQPGAADEAEHAVRDLGLAGVALDPGFALQPRRCDDEVLRPIYERCDELGVPVMITISGNAGPDIGYAYPVYLDQVAAAFPRLQIVVAHGGWPWVLEMLGVAFRRPNVWISPDQYAVNFPGSVHFAEAANSYLADRLLFGSSYPFLPLDGALASWRALPFREDVIERVLGGNAQRLLGLT